MCEPDDDSQAKQLSELARPGHPNADVPTEGARPLTTDELRRGKPNRHTFLTLPRVPLHIILDGVGSGANLGNILRIADAVRAERVWLCESRVRLESSRLLRAAKGITKWVPLTVSSSTLEVVQGLKARGVSILGVELTSRSVSLAEARFKPPVALIVGNESKGMQPSVLALCDLVVSLPALGQGNSVNVGSAAAVVSFWALSELCSPKKVGTTT